MVDRINKSHMPKGRAAAAGHPVRPFQCKWPEGCSKSFNRKSDLQRHYRIHTNERPYACDYKPCEKTFIQRSALTVHRRTHTGDKPHKCPYVGCGKCFSDSSSLARHRRIHTNDKPYICKNSRCRKAFCRKTTMTKHFRKEHPAESLNDDDDDAEYSDIDESEEEASEHSSVHAREGSHGSLQTLEGYRDTPPAPRRASTYSADLWSLPGHSAQSSKPLHMRRSLRFRRDSASDLIKLERSLSGTPQRTLTDPYPNTPGSQRDFLQTVSGALPDSIAPTSSMSQSGFLDGAAQQFLAEGNAAALWQTHAALSDSPTSMTSSASAVDRSHSAFPTPTYPNHPSSVPSQSQINQYPGQAHLSDLQGVEGMIPEEPPHPHFSQLSAAQASQPHSYTGVPVHQHASLAQHHRQQHHTNDGNVSNKGSQPPYHDEVAQATGSLHNHAFAKPADMPYQGPPFAPSGPPELFNVPNQYPPPSNSFYYPDMTGVKDWKDDPWIQMPEQILGGSTNWH